MIFIKPDVEIWKQGYTIDDMWNHIARCTRVCYQSVKRSEDETEEEFVKRVILRHEPWNSDANHLSMLEHGTVYLKYICRWTGDEFVEKYDQNEYSEVTHYLDESVPKSNDGWAQDVFCITTNLRVLVENNWLDDLEYFCAPTKHHARRVTACFTTNIGVSREFNRHRVNSIAEESTRYCNYNTGNDGQINIGLPAWLLDDEHLPYIEGHAFDAVGDYAAGILAQEDDEIVNTWCDMDFYLCALTFSQWCYNMLIRKGWKPQQAREVLPLATKTQLVHTAFVDDWEHFIALRSDGVSGVPHPNAKIVADKLKSLLRLYDYAK